MPRHPAFFEGSEMPTAGWWATLWPDPAAVLEAAGLRRNMDAIDLCCGEGWFTLPMAKVIHQVIAIDLDRNILDAARTRLADAGVSNCEFVEGDAYEVATLTLRPVDFVLMANTFMAFVIALDWRRLCAKR
jgi:ubiquinone/menaquinone biosynthesis C-methylase UbiE